CHSSLFRYTLPLRARLWSEAPGGKPWRKDRREENHVANTIPKLVVLGGERQGVTLEISRPLVIGSNKSSDLHLRDAAVSWNHARIWVEGSEVLVEDLGSASGTLLNGAPVKRAQLMAGDTLTVGSTQVGLEGAGPVSRSEPRREVSLSK